MVRSPNVIQRMRGTSGNPGAALGAPLAALVTRPPGTLERGRGVTLVELGRLDEAEAALRTALEIEPGHTGAESELRYIGELRARGEAAREPLILTPLTGEGKNR